MNDTPTLPALATIDQSTEFLSRLREQKEAVELQSQIELIQYGLNLMRKEAKIDSFRESQALLEAVGDYVDPRWQFDDALGYRYFAPASWMGDRRGGANWPIFRTELELNVIRGQARLVVDMVSQAKGPLDTLTDYVIGTGLSYSFAGARKVKLPPALLRELQATWDEFYDRVNYWELERELFVRLRRDGERFIRLHDGGGRAEVRVIDPEQVTESGHGWDHALLGEQDRQGWTFGIHTDRDDVCQVYGYNVIWDTLGDPEYVNSHEMIHTKVNVDRNVKRGLSDFYPINDNLEGTRKLLKNTREGAAIQAAIAFIRQFPPGTAQGSVQSIVSQKTDFPVPRLSATDVNRTAQTQKFDTGTILNIPAGMQYLAGPMGSNNAPNYNLVIQAALRAVGVRWAMPEAIISGDASNANYASALVAEGPFAKRVESLQQQEAHTHRLVAWHVLRSACLWGRFERFGITSWGQFRRLVDVTVNSSQVATRDRNQETQRRQTLNGAGILSKRTWAAQEDLDYDDEQANRKKDSDAQQSPAAVTGNGADSESEQRMLDLALHGSNVPESITAKVRRAFREYP